MLTSAESFIGTHRLRQAVEDTPALRVRLARLLETAELDPPGIPPSAILIVRRLRDPLPGGIVEDEASPRVSARWEHAVRAELDEEYRGAARPLAGPVPAGANAVRFADRAELLAMLARDLAAGEAGSRWWWRAVLRPLPRASPESLAEAWCREPQYVPAALAILAGRGEASRTVATLSAVRAWRVFTAVAGAYDVVPLTLMPMTTGRDASPLAAGPPAASEPVSQQLTSPSAGDPMVQAAAPWRGLIPNIAVPESLSPEHQALLGAGLVLAARPQEARTRAFRETFQAWRAAAEARRTTARQHERTNAARDGDARRSPGTRGENPRATGYGGPAPAGNDQIPVPLDPAVTGATGKASSKARLAVPDAARPEEIATSLGGIFFLVNMFESLDLPACLEDTFGVTGSLGGWGWLELVARCLIGAGRAELAHDPVWEVLAELDGRDPKLPPGGDFAGQDRYRLPAPWLCLRNGEAAAPCVVCTSRGWAQLWDERGVILATRRLAARPSRATLRAWCRDEGVDAARLARALPRRFKEHAACRPLGMELAPDLSGFMAFLAPYLRWRLLAALGLEDQPPETLVDKVLAQDARLAVTRSHVDISMDPDRVRISIRLAGLDADPGWVPQLGRVVLFHFV